MAIREPIDAADEIVIGTTVLQVSILGITRPNCRDDSPIGAILWRLQTPVHEDARDIRRCLPAQRDGPITRIGSQITDFCKRQDHFSRATNAAV